MRLEDLQFPGNQHGEVEVALAGEKYHLAPAELAALPEGLQHCELIVVEFGMGDRLRVAVEALILVFDRVHGALGGREVVGQHGGKKRGEPQR